MEILQAWPLMRADCMVDEGVEDRTILFMSFFELSSGGIALT